MKKLFTLLLLFIYCQIGYTQSQWQYVGPWPDTTFKGGSHGVTVSPDGKVWQSSYYRENWITPNGDTVLTSPIYVFDENGNLLNKLYTITSGAVVDTLGKGGSTSGCRGLETDTEGNILYVSGAPSKIIRINYQTYEGMGSRLIGNEIGSSPTAPAVSADGTIYVGPVVGNGSSSAIIANYDLSLNYLGNAVIGPPQVARTMEISSDGLKLYWLPFTGLKMFVYTRPDEFSPFALTDSLFEGMSIESSAWQPGTNYLWVSNDSRGTNYSHLTWYGIDLSSNSIADSFTLVSPFPGASDEFPRALAFSPDGSTAYVGLFGTAFHRIYKFVKPTSVDDNGLTVVDGYKLSQNYPNPFNPTTTINFELPKNGYTTLKIYDMLGNEVATLIDKEMTVGQHSVKFSAQNLASGTYLYQLNVNGVRISNKMILMK